ncbi:uncharacterized protein LOC6586068 [Drosophila mojavensis]|uniref:Uncharacterized protein n=1 Tax=Drosophila mojavensis TaxID=7230 RepID=B4L8A6_DROMO|nr:uncharacterized protein LOC6586068 [Drosophila mojavensis]EDW05681.2 uncharacterized protein Dmoj_GI11170 [Drosophila mojavensis]
MQSIRKVLKVWRKFVSFLKSCRDALTVEERTPKSKKPRRPMTAQMVRNKRKKEKKRSKMAKTAPKTKRTQTDPRAEVLWLQQLMQSSRKKHKFRRGARLALKLHLILLMAVLTFGVVNNIGVWIEVVAHLFNYTE